MLSRKTWILFVLAGVPLCARAQWLHHPLAGTPRAADGKPNLAAPAPQASNGKPDLSGIWMAQSSPIPELIELLPGGINGLGESTPSKYFLNILADFKKGQEPLLPAATASLQQRSATIGRDAPLTHCLPAGVPQSDLMPTPFKLIQTPGVIVMLYELDNSFRQIFTDGRKQLDDPQPSWLGYSVGKWEGDWLVVDTIGFNNQSWLDASGHTHSEALRVTERFHRRDFGHLEVELHLDDPQTFSKPVSIRFTEQLIPDTDLIESFCAEGEKDVAHMPAK
jgi:hypothetical protein